MAKYLFRLDTMRLNAQRNYSSGNMADYETVTFLIELGAKQFGPLKNYGWWDGLSGRELDFSQAHRVDRNFVGRGTWEIGPIEVADSDVMTVDYGVVNAYDSISLAQSQHGNSSAVVTQVGIATEAALLGVAAAAAGATAGAAAVAIAIGAGLFAVFAAILKGAPNCDGVVGGNKTSFSGAELRQATSNAQQMFSVSETAGNPDTPEGCGKSEIVMTYSVTFVPYSSLSEFLISKSQLTPTNIWTRGRGFRDYTASVLPSLYSGPSTSVRDVIKNWELLVIP